MTESKKILNLYAGIGGNRKLWNEVVDDLEVTAIEIEKEIAEVYQDNFPQDEVIIGDAHSFLLNNFKDNWDFIWSSPPCPTHSKFNFTRLVNEKRGWEGYNLDDIKYPDMNLYQEIILLKTFFRGKYCVENVQTYYKPLIKPQKIQRHYFWCNFFIPDLEIGEDVLREKAKISELENHFGFDIPEVNVEEQTRRKLLRNCVHPKLGKHIFESALNSEKSTLEAFMGNG